MLLPTMVPDWFGFKNDLTCNENVSLYTIRHYNETVINQIEKGKTVLLKQLTQETIQVVTK